MDPSSIWQYQLQTLLSTSYGYVAIALLGLLMVWAIGSHVGRGAALSLLIYVTAFAIDVKTQVTSRLITPLQEIRQLSEPLMLGLLIVIMVAPVFGKRFSWRRPQLGGIVMFLVFQLLFDVRQVMDRTIARGVLGVVIHLIIFLALIVGLSTQIRTFWDANTVVRCLAFAMTLFAISTAIQLIVNRSAVLVGSRLQATTGNPQAVAVLIAGLIPAVFYLLLRREEHKLTRVAMAALAALLLIFLAWTGSRTGALMTIVGLVMLFRLRIGAMLTATVIVGGFIYMGLAVFSEGPGEALYRLADVTNTRASVWQQSIDAFWTHPLTGAGVTEAAYHESSYLSVLATMGIIGSIPFAAAFVLIARSLLQLQRRRAELGVNAPLADMVTSGLVAYAVGGIFEAIFFGTFANPVYMMFIYLTLLRFLLDRVAVAADETTETSEQAFSGEQYFSTGETSQPRFQRDAFGR